jgi:hypothetical protein
MLQGQVTDLVEVELLGFAVDAVVTDLKPLARHIDRGPVGEVAAVG